MSLGQFFCVGLGSMFYDFMFRIMFANICFERNQNSNIHVIHVYPLQIWCVKHKHDMYPNNNINYRRKIAPSSCYPEVWCSIPALADIVGITSVTCLLMSFPAGLWAVHQLGILVFRGVLAKIFWSSNQVPHHSRQIYIKITRYYFWTAWILE